MPFIVSHRGAFERRRIDDYLRLLRKRGIDWTDAPRVPDPETEDRWWYVWDNRDEAEGFCKELRKDTRDKKWGVHTLPADVQALQGSLIRVVILMRPQSLGAEFTLYPHSETLVRRRFPSARLVHWISVEGSTVNDVEQQQHGPMWDHIAQVLTGLTDAQLEDLGGYQIFDRDREQTVFDSRNAVPHL
jgi:hypothetical protein